MATILLIGSDEPALEGLAQALSAAGHRTSIARTLAEAADSAALDPPLITLVERGCAATSEFLRLPLTPGGALVVYRTDDSDAPPLPTVVQRATLADLSLPLERQRLLALVQHVEERAKMTGRPHRTGAQELER